MACKPMSVCLAGGPRGPSPYDSDKLSGFQLTSFRCNVPILYKSVLDLQFSFSKSLVQYVFT